MQNAEKVVNNEVVLVIYVGGTIGMIPGENGVLIPAKGSLYKHIRQLAQMHDEQYYKEKCDHNLPEILVLPDSNNNNKRVLYHILEWEAPMDSCDFTIREWNKIAMQIKENYDNYIGFVILHGTDTMAYTASALSMMLENLNKPVVITGAQIPIFDLRTDGTNNFISSLLIAGTQNIPEVTLYFNNKLFRGNRSTKISNVNLSAFDSPNYEPLANLGIHLVVNSRALIENSNPTSLVLHQFEAKNIAIIHIYPGISAEYVRKILEPPTEGAILLTYGSGNIPLYSTKLCEELKLATERNIIIVNITQCQHGSVQPIYLSGQILNELNVVAGIDMTLEACYAKIIYVLSRNEWNFETKKNMLMNNLRGELTIRSN